jgi:hypothetical protein
MVFITPNADEDATIRQVAMLFVGLYHISIYFALCPLSDVTIYIYP